MRRSIAYWRLLAAIALLLTGGFALHQQPPALAQSTVASTSAGSDIDPGRLIVILKPYTDASETYSVASEYADRTGSSVTHRYTSLVSGFSGQFDQNAINDLVKDPSVASIIPDRPVYPASQSMPTGTDRIDADLNPTKAGDGHNAVDVDVAIFDTGIYKHADLNVVGGLDCTGNGNPYDDEYGHGTAVAGIVGAKDNSSGVVGIAPGARLWALRVAGADGLAYISNVMCAQDWMANHSFIKIINFSFAGPDGGYKETCTSGATRQGFCELKALGITTFVAAGNDSVNAGTYEPAQFPEVITVSAIADYDGKPGGLAGFGDDEFAYFSNYGSVVDIAAPGVDVETTATGGGYESFSGTSGASPAAAGAAALLVAQQGISGRDAILKRLILSSEPGAIPYDPDNYHEPIVNVAQLGLPKITSKSSAYPGDSVRVNVSGFMPAMRVTWRFDGAYMGGATVGSDGKASLTFTIPASVSGPHTIAVSNTRKSVSTTITVKPKLWLSTTSTTVGSSIKATMKGYRSGESIAVTFDGRSMGTVNASSSGTATLTFTVPATSGGSKTVRATGNHGSSYTSSVTLTPTLVLTNAPVGPGTPAKVTVRGFQPGEVITFRLDHSNGMVLSSGTASSTGSGSFTVPLTGVPVGSHRIFAVGGLGTVKSVATGMTSAEDDQPTPIATASPTSTSVATDAPSPIATETATPAPTETATEEPTESATSVPTDIPTAQPTETPSPTIAPADPSTPDDPIA